MMSIKKILVSIISSEKTWTNFSKFGFDKKIAEQRQRFELAIVLNGFNKDAIEYFSKFNPDYFFLRPNLGYDPAAVEHLIKLIPVFETTLIIHDDHWFNDSNWLDTIIELRENNHSVDILGNIFNSQPQENLHEYYKDRSLEVLSGIAPSKFLHGLSGIYSSKAIENLKSFKFNYPLTNEKRIADLGERTFTSALIYLKINYSQLPGGIFKFLFHNETNERDHLFWTANALTAEGKYLEAREYYLDYLKFCENNNFQRDYIVAFYNIAQISYVLNDFTTAVNYCKKCLTITPGFPPVVNLLNQIKEKIDV